MKILVGVSHPKHVLIFKNVVSNLIERGHEIKIVAVEKEITEYLLNRFNMPHTTIGKNQPKFHRKLLGLPKWEYLTYKIAKEFKPDIFVGRALPHLAHVSMLLNKPFIIFEDTEIARLLHKITVPFASSIVTPECYRGDFGKKHLHFNGYFELAYLHSNNFMPDPRVLDDVGLNKNDTFTILRFVAWGASHDVGQHGIKNKKELVEELEKYGRVFITSETPLPEELEKYRISIPPEEFHSLLYYAALYVGDGGTTASEAAVLGTPAVFISTVVSGYLYDEEKYGLVHVFSDPKTGEKEGVRKALELLKDDSLKNDAQEKREKLLNGTIDVTSFMSWFIENYPESSKEMKEHPEKQYKIR